MKKSKALPVVTRKKRIDLKKFTALASKVRKHFEEEAEYLEEQEKRDADRHSTRLLPSS